MVMMVLFGVFVALFMQKEEKTGKDAAESWSSRVCIEIVREPIVSIIELIDL